jgi:outer membrane immunogenic protein
MRSRALLVVVLSGAAMVSAHAADQSVRGPSSYYPNAYYPTSIDWTGWYTGVQVGGGFASASWTDPFSGLSDSPKATSVLGGAQFGANWMRDSWLLGAEADFTWTDLKGSATDAAGFAHHVSSHWLSLITGRLGYAFNRYLLYAKGGAAFASERNKVTNPAGNLADSGTTTQYGWTFGGGLEYAIDPNWSARVEYDYAAFPPRNVVLVGPVLGTQPATPNFTVQKVVGGVNYRF